MNLISDYLNSGATGAPPGSYPVPSYPTGLTDITLVANAWNTLQMELLAAQTFITALTATLSTIETAVGNGSLAAYAAQRCFQGNQADGQTAIFQLGALYMITSGGAGTAGADLLSYATAQFLTPFQTAVTNFTAAYAAQIAQLKAEKRI